MANRIWGRGSQVVYNELHERLQRVVTRIRDEVADITLLEGYRNQERQDALFQSGESQVVFPNGKHNRSPSWAVDFQPSPRPLEDNKLWGALGYVAGAAIRIAKEEGVILRWGGDWNCNGDTTDQRFYDLFHLEIVEVLNEAQVPDCAPCGGCPFTGPC